MEPSKTTPNEQFYDFFTMQDEIGRELGIVNKATQYNMNQGMNQTNILDILSYFLLISFLLKMIFVAKMSYLT